MINHGIRNRRKLLMVKTPPCGAVTRVLTFFKKGNVELGLQLAQDQNHRGL